MRLHATYLVLMLLAGSAMAQWTSNAWDPAAADRLNVQRDMYFITATDVITIESTTNYFPGGAAGLGAFYFRATNVTFGGYGAFPAMATNYFRWTNVMPTHAHVYAPLWTNNPVLGPQSWSNSWSFGPANSETATVAIARTYEGKKESVWMDASQLRVYEAGMALQERIIAVWATYAPYLDTNGNYVSGSGLGGSMQAEQDMLDDALVRWWGHTTPGVEATQWRIDAWKSYSAHGNCGVTNVVLFGEGYPMSYAAPSMRVDGNDYADILQAYKEITESLFPHFVDTTISNDFELAYNQWYNTPARELTTTATNWSDTKWYYVEDCNWARSTNKATRTFEGVYLPSPMTIARVAPGATDYSFEQGAWLGRGDTSYWWWTPTKHSFSTPNYAPGAIITQQLAIIPTYETTNQNAVFTNTAYLYSPRWEDGAWTNTALITGTNAQIHTLTNYNYFVITNRLTDRTEADYGWPNLRDGINQMRYIDTDISWVDRVQITKRAGPSTNVPRYSFRHGCMNPYAPNKEISAWDYFVSENLSYDEQEETEFRTRGSYGGVRLEMGIDIIPGDYSSLPYGGYYNFDGGDFYGAASLPEGIAPTVTEYEPTIKRFISPPSWDSSYPWSNHNGNRTGSEWGRDNLFGESWPYSTSGVLVDAWQEVAGKYNINITNIYTNPLWDCWVTNTTAYGHGGFRVALTPGGYTASGFVSAGSETYHYTNSNYVLVSKVHKSDNGYSIWPMDPSFSDIMFLEDGWGIGGYRWWSCEEGGGLVWTESVIFGHAELSMPGFRQRLDFGVEGGFKYR